ncbi:sulfatase family protein [Niabella drilacis]|uniref:Arylsulfatase A n=1 Tax=Niabella drilacis (strain DSM 25811 / CCM 8410 / CCUG 62505 / LMG 26954 / E90) TaxID=1285928 RepID=A0A1G6IW85_NIADE|nr:sulfatase [Niabella drilacis]SDC10738.1 Arylsulfatase A [Niabella drilacis]
MKLKTGIGILLLAGLSPGAMAQQKRPNIVYIMSDDHGYQAVSAYGYGLNHTPNIDRLAKEGALFTQATVTNSLCAPSRAVLLTGKHSFINGKVDNMARFNWDQDNFAKQLQQHGYQTALIGKIHMDGLPQGFDYSAVLIDQGEYYNPNFIINGQRQQVKGYVTDLTTDMTLDWIAKRDTSRPFCVLYHQKAPHREWLPALRHIKEYTQQTFKEPPTLFDNYAGRGTAAHTAEMNILKHMNWAGDNKIPPALMDELGIQQYLSWDKAAYNNNLGRMTPEERSTWDSVYNPIMEDFKKRYPKMTQTELMRWRYQRYMQDYLGTVAAVDDGVGRLLDFLKQNGLDENTIVIYTSDQGFYLGEHGWFDKRFMYEESLRTPLLIRYPAEIPSGRRSAALVQNLDFAPTLLDYAGIQPPQDMQGRSFRRLLNGKDTSWRDAAYYTYYEYPGIHAVKRHYGIRTDRYKLIHFYYDVNEWELYDLQKDPHELKSVYNDPAYAGTRKTMHKKLEQLRKQYGDSDQNDQRFLNQALKKKAP